MNNIVSTEWYKELIEETKAIIVESIFNARDTVIRGKWAIGQRITQEKDNFEKAGITGGAIITTVGKSLGASVSELYSCVKFYEKFPDLEKFLGKQNKNLSWHKVVHELLPEHTETKKREEQLCPKCGQKIGKGNPAYQD